MPAQGDDHHMITILETREELERHSLGGELGTMDAHPHDYYLEQARVQAAAEGVGNPTLLALCEYRDATCNMAGREVAVVPITEAGGWFFVNEGAGEFYKSSPRVYVVDGDKFGAEF